MAANSDDELPPLQQGDSSGDDVGDEIEEAKARLVSVEAAEAKKTANGNNVTEPPAEEDNDDDDADEVDEDEDEEEKPYGKKAVKKMMKAMKKGVDTSFGANIEPDEDGYKPITWTQLADAFSYERVAHGFKLRGDISHKDREHWERAKQIKVRDADGREGAVFFYDEEAKPYFEWENIEVGNEIVVKSPRFHRFLDGQEGMRLESNKNVGCVAKKQFTDAQRLDYGKLNKGNGNTKYAKKKYDDAIGCYETAIGYLQGTFHDHPENEQEAKELAAQCHLNIAACQIGQGRFGVVEIPCRAALRVNATPQLNAKAYYRIGHAALKRHELPAAREALTKAQELAPGDAAIVQEIQLLNEALLADSKAQKELFKLDDNTNSSRRFGLRRSVLGGVPSRVELGGVENFRDAGAGRVVQDTVSKPLEERRIIPRFELYRSSNLVGISRGGLRELTEELRVKTILDLRSDSEIKMSFKVVQERYARFNEENAVDITLYKKTDGDAGVPAREIHRIESKFSVVTVKTAKGADPKHTVVNLKDGMPKAATLEAAREDAILYRVDLQSRTILSLASWWTLFCAFFLGLLAFVYTPLLRVAAKVMIKGTASRVGIDALYRDTLEKQGPEFKFILEVAADPTNYPILIHCSMGKDRTGLAVAMLLALAGASDHEIVSDYASSSISQETLEALGDLTAVMGDDLLAAKPETMRGVLPLLRSEEYYERIGVPKETLDAVRANLRRPMPKRRA